MKETIGDLLLPYEWQALREALERDIANESRMADFDRNWRNWHLMNVRLSTRVLEALPIIGSKAFKG